MIVMPIACKTCGMTVELRSNEGFPAHCPSCCSGQGWKPSGKPRQATEEERMEPPRWKPDKYE